MIPGRWQSMAELSYVFIANMVKDNVGSEGRPYFPFIFTIFMFILVGNFWGMMPYSFTFTSHIAVTFAMAFFVFVGVTLIAIAKHKLHLLIVLYAAGRADGDGAAAGTDRDHLVSLASDQPERASVCEHAGRPHAAESVRGLYHLARRRRRLAAVRVRDRVDGPGIRDRLPAGVRVRHSDVPLPQRCAASALRAVRTIIYFNNCLIVKLD